MTIRKLLARGLLPSLLALSLSGTCSGMIAFAESTEEVVEFDPVSDADGYTLIVKTYCNDMGFVSQAEDVCYPSVGYVGDLSATLTVDGKKYTSEMGAATAEGSGQRNLVFSGLPSLPESGTVTFSTDANSYIRGFDASDYAYMVVDDSGNLSKSFTFNSSNYENSYYSYHDKETDDSVTEVNPYEKMLSVNLSSGYYGLNSLQIIWSYDISDYYTPEYYYENNKEFAPELLTNAAVYIDDTKVSTCDPRNGVVYFRTPTKFMNSFDGYNKAANIRLELTGFNTREVVLGYTASIPLSIPKSGVSANKYCINLAEEDVVWLDATDTDEKPDNPREVDEAEGNIVSLDITPSADYDATLAFTVNSSLSDYKFNLVSYDPYIYVNGSATEAFIENNDRYGYSVGDDVNWGAIDGSSSGNQTVSVAAGTYKLVNSDALNVKYSGKLSVKTGKTNDITLTVSPKYTLAITSKAGMVDCSISDVTYSGDKQFNFVLDVDKEYYIKDNDSGKTYKVQATKDMPNVKLELGGSIGVVADDDVFEDVPNTADPMSTILIVVGVLAVLFAGSFVLVYRANKKNERG